MSALAKFERTDDLMMAMLSNLASGDLGKFLSTLNTEHTRALFSMVVRLQLVSKRMRRAVLAVWPLWERVFQAHYLTAHESVFCGHVLMRQVNQLCLLHPALRERCSIEFDLQFFNAANCVSVETPLDQVSHVEGMCASWPLLKGICHRMWVALFQRLARVVIKRNLLPEALAFVRRFHALHPQALTASRHTVSLLVARFTHLMMHAVFVEFGHDPNARCEKDGRTALMEAVQATSADVIEEFVVGAFATKAGRKRKVARNPYGLDLTLRCNAGLTVFDYVDKAESERFRNEVRASLETLC